jgi:hypothetical protein
MADATKAEKSKKENVDSALMGVIGVVMVSSLAAIGLLGFQVLFYLHDGFWTPLPAVYLFERPPIPQNQEARKLYVALCVDEARSEARRNQKGEIDEEAVAADSLAHLKSLQSLTAFVPCASVKWISRPTGWLGLHKIVRGVLDEVSITVFVIGSGLMLLWVGTLFISEPNEG